MAVPAEQGLGLVDHERPFPARDTAREQEQPEAIPLIETRRFDLTPQNQKLVRQERIFGEELRFDERKIGEGPGQ